MVVIAIFRVIKAPFIDGNLSIIDCYAEAVHVFRNFVHVIKNRLVGAPVHVIEKTVHVHENCCSRVLRILTKYESWFMEGRLQPGVHYIEIKDDYSDLEDKIQYYSTHVEEAEAIIRNAHAFVEQFRDKEREELISILVLEKYFRHTKQ